jgi:hypothetical protein
VSFDTAAGPAGCWPAAVSPRTRHAAVVAHNCRTREDE